MNFYEAKELLGGNAGFSDYLTAKGTDTEKFIKGIQILSKYSSDIPIGSEHDIFYVCEHPEEMPKEEIIELSTLGFHLDDDGECWAKFV